MSASASTKPSQVLIIRHGEKLGDSSNEKDGGPNLSIRGSSRAAAIPSLFAPANPQLAYDLVVNGQSFTGSYPPVALQGNAPRFSPPQFLFATQASKGSNRPVETVTPLSAALNLAYDDKHADKDYGHVATDILNNSKYEGKIVLICWHHGNIQNMAIKLGIAQPPPWPGSVFDRIWVITYPNDQAALQDLPQMLLFGDSST
jgi:hypothetical protein